MSGSTSSGIRARGLDGLAARLAVRALPGAVEAASDVAATGLANAIAEETGAGADITGPAGARVVRVGDPGFAARMSGDAGAPGDPLLSRLILEAERGRGR